MVADIIDGRQSRDPYPPGAPQLQIVNHHRPLVLEDLAPAELAQLHAAWYSEDGPGLSAALHDEENDIEAAQVVDETGTLRYRLYGWNYGVGYLFPAEGLEVVAFGAQHDLEHWSRDQRDLFAGMDRAMRARGHGFRQPLSFCWDNDECWDEIPEDAEPHSRRSEPYLLRQFARAAQEAPR
jgi:hypothetical protein